MRVRVQDNWVIALMFAALLVGGAGSARLWAQPGQAAPSDHAAQPPAAGEHKAEAGAPAGEEGAPEGERNPILGMIARLFNFSIVAGVLIYFLRSPIADYLSGRAAQIKADLVKAADMRVQAAADLADIDKKMRALPDELDALRKAGAEEVAAEEARIRQAAESERARLLEVTRREVATQLKLAERQLMQRAADLAIAVASERVKATITDADQLRLVDRYLVQVAASER